MSDGEQDPEQKTEEPTQKRLDDARKKGQIPVSREINSFLVLFAGTFLLLLVMPFTFKYIYKSSIPMLAISDQFFFDGNALKKVAVTLFEKVTIGMSLPLGLLVVAALAGGLLQTKGNVSMKPLEPKISNLSLQKGIKKIFSTKSLIEFIKGIFKICLVAFTMYWVFSDQDMHFEKWIHLSPKQLCTVLMDNLQMVLIPILSVLFIVAAIDYMYQRHSHMQELRMTMQEIKDEYKQSEGDPMVKSKIKQLRRERAQNKMMDQVKTSTAVVTNPTHFAVAIYWDESTMPAPKVTAKGQDYMAFKIREIADENKVPILENKPLARSLFANVEVDEDIQPEHYEAVAKIIHLVNKMKKQRF